MKFPIFSALAMAAHCSQTSASSSLFKPSLSNPLIESPNSRIPVATLRAEPISERRPDAIMLGNSQPPRELSLQQHSTHTILHGLESKKDAEVKKVDQKLSQQQSTLSIPHGLESNKKAKVKKEDQKLSQRQSAHSNQHGSRSNKKTDEKKTEQKPKNKPKYKKNKNSEKGPRVDGKLHGPNGKRVVFSPYWGSKDIYEGTFEGGDFTNGTHTTSHIVQTGAFKKGRLHGHNNIQVRRKPKSDESHTYSGHFHDGYFLEGAHISSFGANETGTYDDLDLVNGTKYSANGSYQSGTFRFGKLHGPNGKVVFHHPDSEKTTTLIGTFNKGYLRQGTRTFPDGTSESGTFTVPRTLVHPSTEYFDMKERAAHPPTFILNNALAGPNCIKIITQHPPVKSLH